MRLQLECLLFDWKLSRVFARVTDRFNFLGSRYMSKFGRGKAELGLGGRASSRHGDRCGERGMRHQPKVGSSLNDLVS